MTLALAARTAAPAGPGYAVLRAGIDTGQEPVLFLHRDAPACRAEGFASEARLHVAVGSRQLVATLHVVSGPLLRPDQVGLSESAWEMLQPAPGAAAMLEPQEPLESLRHVRAKIHGRRLDEAAFRDVVRDVVAGRLANAHIAAFLAACASHDLDAGETVALCRSMLAAGDRLHWPVHPVLDKHSVGGLPGNRTTLVVVPIVAAAGLVMPKTSSRAITSPAGTADTMEVLAPVDLDAAAIRRVVERAGGCIVWGGRARLSPADDRLIRVERLLDLDAEAQLVASVLSKKAAAGSTHVLVDVPVGPTVKVRSAEAAERIGARLVEVGAALGLDVVPVQTDGSQPVGRGIGPALEARDVLAVLRNEPGAPADLRERSLHFAGRILELGGAASAGAGLAAARAILADGRAWDRFQRIAEAQGGLRTPPVAGWRRPVPTARGGRVIALDNRRLARIAKLAGAPADPAAGLELHARLGDEVDAGQPLYTVYAESPGELEYALAYAAAGAPAVRVEGA